MDTNVLQGKWQQMRGEVKSRWGMLTDDDLNRIEGNRDRLVGTVQEKYGYARQQAEKEVDRFLSEHEETISYYQEKGQNVVNRFQERMPSDMRRTMNDNPWMMAGLAALALVLVFTFIIRSSR